MAHDAGRAPMIRKNRRSQYAYLRSVKEEMPVAISRRIAFWGWIAKFAMALIWVLIAVEAVLQLP